MASQIAKNYIELRFYQEKLQILEDNIALLEQTINLAKAKIKSEVGTDFDLSKTLLDKQIALANEPFLKSQIDQRIFTISTLLGKNPQFLYQKLIKSQNLPSIIEPAKIGFKSDILKNRYDIAIAEIGLNKSAQEIGVAKSKFFPSFSLSGAAGISSLKFDQVFNYDNRFWNYGFGINLPIFSLPAINANYQIAKNNNDIALLNYQKTIVNVLGEVESSLSDYISENKRNDQIELALKNSKKIVDLADVRYRLGAENLQSVIDAKRDYINVKEQEITTKAEIRLKLITLFKALGGGF